ncbi:MAG: Pr6Pr family membrane protein [Candidatus Izimaplasma sp.]|nr:Pr6Pr family membrane protein [Candidatus Izimaplasma bacterium]
MNKMHINKTIKFLIVISSGLGISLTLIDLGFSLSPFKYFTHLSNLFVLSIYLMIFFKIKHKSKLFTIIKYQAVVSIVLTGLIYNFVLRPSINSIDYEVNSLADILVHTLTPILVIFDNLFFSKKGIIKRKYPLYWLIFPLIYYLCTLIYSFFGGKFHLGTSYESNYPYFFLNISEYGFGYFIIIVLIILVIGYTIFYINNFLYKDKEERKNGSI